MAGNIVKWWKHKILGGYKQFSVLQECTTDSEELMYPIRAPSSCSAPPDLLLVSDRENVQRKSPVNIISATKSKQQHNAHNSHHSHSQQQQNLHQQQQQHPQKEPQSNAKQSSQHKHSETPTNHGIEGPHQKNDDERMHLEEFTCDVSVEGGKSSQPLQFSFTFYDLDGHHGKITKDDIVGIVYTIYESIGKNVVVPHCGSKTINVRLTVSPEGKSKSTGKHKKMHMSTAGQQQHSRRQHRYRPKKLIKSDDEDDEGDSASDREAPTNDKKGPTSSSKFNKLNAEAVNNQNQPCCSEGRINQDASPVPQSKLIDSSQNCSKTGQQQQQLINCKYPTGAENIYESVANIKCCPKESRKDELLEGCKECAQSSLQQQHQQYLKQASIRAKILRKARKQKYQEQCYESRQRSLSVGNESCWKIRSGRTAQDEVDGRAVPTAECWNNALKRNDLIDIIRESMEKNRLCFQSNGKPQPNVSPVRHRQRSNTTVAPKVVDENYSPQTSHHIPIYHQQMAINPAILAQNNRIGHQKTNLCGYDSFLHATICSAMNNTTQNAVPNQQHQQSLVNSPKIYVNTSNIAKSSKLLKNGYHSQQNSPQFHGYQRLSSSHGHTKLNTSMLNALSPHLSAEEKLHRTIDHVEKWLSERDQSVIKANDLKNLKYTSDESKCKKDVKNYDNLLHSKLDTPRKSVQENNVINNNKENIRRLQHNQHYQILQKRNIVHSLNSATPVELDKIDTSDKFVTVIPVDVVDPIECENLIHPTSDEDTLPSTPSGSANGGGTEGADDSGPGNSNNGNNSNSSSMVHRYVHEHIHHHYHHFENKQN